jgi:hypothetical protein
MIIVEKNRAMQTFYKTAGNFVVVIAVDFCNLDYQQGILPS